MNMDYLKEISASKLLALYPENYYGDHDRCRTNYFATYQDLYFTGDGA
jgi:acyl-coenzyme A synthetase/AMP-(fatty) acid ligase